MKRKRRIQWYYSVILLAFGLTACQVKRPDTVISDAKMENVLYDFHIAKAMGEEVPYSESYKRVLYIESVYRKHGITQADFDTSMVWYARHPDALTKVYEKVNQRLKAERDGINHLIALRDNKPKESSPGDSIDVWRGRHICYLTGTPMDKLHGGAKRMAQMSNIGGGSKATGGGGVDEGMKAMLQYTQANTVKKMVSQSEKKKISGKK